jgi:hypothetical protein
MTAQSITALSNRRAGTISAYTYGDVAIDSTADTALAAITTSSSVRDVLKVIDACIARARAVDSDSFGLATASLTSTAPTDIALSASALATGSVGTSTPVTIGTLSATAGTHLSVTFSLVSGTGDTNNGVFSIDGTTLQYTGAAASAGSLSVRVRVTDGNGGTFDEALTITVS